MRWAAGAGRGGEGGDAGQPRAGRRREWLAAALFPLAVAACGDAPSATGWTGTADTLPSGTVVVSNPAQGLWDESTRWTLVEDLRLGEIEGDSPEVFGRLGDIEVDDEGRIYVLEAQAFEVRVFGPDGAHVRTFGRQGEGPGEFSRPHALAIGPEGGLWVVDMGNHRYSVFDATGTLVDEKRRFTDGQVWPWPGAVLRDGRVVEGSLGDGVTLTLHAPDGAVLDTVALPEYEASSFVHSTEGMRVSYGVPFAPYLDRFVDPGGFLWTGVNQDYRLVKRDLTGKDSLLIVRRAYDPVAVADHELDRAIEGLGTFIEQGGRVDRSRIPDHHPAFHDFLVDREGYLWVEPVIPSPPPDPEAEGPRLREKVWDVFDPRGRYQGRVETGMYLSNVRITETHVYGITRDDLGVQYVVRLRIEGRGGG